MHDAALDQTMLHRAALLAWRGCGLVEPNPLVGCVIARTESRRPVTLGLGHHRRFGGPHAEAEALADAARRGVDVRGATAYVTLEPCHAQGKQPPCSQALLKAGIARVVYARADPNPAKSGGAAWLRSQGVECIEAPTDLARLVGAPFIQRLKTHRPWTIAKWAQTRAGSMTTGDDGSRWISGEFARRRVHVLRSRADAIITGIGTVLADDPLLTVRGIAWPRKRPLRVVIDPSWQTPVTGNLVRSAAEAQHEPRVLVYGSHALQDAPEVSERIRRLQRHGAMIGSAPLAPGQRDRLDLHALATSLHQDHAINTALLEAGPTLLRGFIELGLIDQAVVFVANTPCEHAWPLLGPLATSLEKHGPWRLVRQRQVGPDAELVLVREEWC